MDLVWKRARYRSFVPHALVYDSKTAECGFKPASGWGPSEDMWIESKKCAECRKALKRRHAISSC